MNGQPGQSAPQKPVLVIYIVLLAFLQAMAIYAALVFFMDRDKPPGPPPDSAILAALGAFAAIGAAIGFAAGRVFLKPPEDQGPEAFIAAFTTGHIIRCAGFETMGVLGLVGHFMGAPRGFSLGLLAAGFILLLSLLPATMAGVEKYKALLRAGR